MVNNEDICVVCEREPKKRNPILFCDGEGCDMPVHKECHGVDEIPEGEWFCVRCETKRKNQPVNTVCCPTQTGALKPTTHEGDFIHIVCAKWNPAIDHNKEPYEFDRVQLGAYECHVCRRKEGICIGCSEPACKRYFHVTCAINSGLIPATKLNSDNFTFACNEHRSEDQMASRPRAARRRLVKKEMLHSSDEDEDDNDDEDDTEDDEDKDDDEDVDEDTVMEDASDNEVPKKRNSQRRNSRRSASKLGVKRRSTASHGSKTGPLKLFLSDQSDTDEEQKRTDKQPRASIKEEEKTGKPESITEPSAPTAPAAAAAAAAVTPATSSPLSFRERMEAKRKKAKQAAEEPAAAVPIPDKPVSGPPPVAKVPAPAASNSSSKHSPSMQQPTPPMQTAPTVNKQKLPNRAHLAPNQRPTNTLNGSGLKRPSASAAATPVIKDFDQITRDLLDGAEQRWGTSAASLNTPQTPTTPHQPFAFNGPDRRPPPQHMYNAGPRRSIEGGPGGDFTEYQKTIMRNKLYEMVDEVFAHRGGPNMEALQSRLQVANQEVNRLREDMRRMQEFKRTVAEVFVGLNVQVPSGLPASTERIEEYVNELRSMIARTGPVNPRDQEQILDYVKKIV
ncbi:hypothetical protein VTP01DRAFT_7707 [Rhizomucor pusillus]|uniref:uncharacterized protein n=1 Tax=Rhizomucor pusillus TaxID=4840 RepID=UPI0037441B8E